MIELDHSHLTARNNTAWILATADDDEVRDGALALRISEQLARAEGHTDQGLFLRTLAAARAENGDFEGARKAVAQGLSLSGANGLRTLLERDLKSYDQEKPVRETR